MGLGSILKVLGGIGSVAAAPFTGGTSLAWLPAALAGTAAAGGLMENTKGARTSTSTSMAVDSPENATIANQLRIMLSNRMNTPVDMSGYEANGVSGINDTYRSIAQGLQNQMTARGLGSSPVAGNAQTNLAMHRGGDIAQFRNTIPLVQNDLQNQSISQAMQFYNAQPRTVTQSGVAPGSMAGGAFSSVAEMLAYLAGKGILGKPGAPGGPVTNKPGSIYTGDIPGTLNA